MWAATDLGDYELLDASDGERLERWGKYVLIRPDPQVIWKGLRRHPAWNKADASYARSSSGGGGETRSPIRSASCPESDSEGT